MLVLRANSQPPGTTFRWQDGSTDSTLTVTQAGRYSLEVRSAAGCPARDSLLVRDQPCAALPNIITPNGDPLNQTFVLAGLRAADWSIRIFNRWGWQVYFAPHYDNLWAGAGQSAGIYYYLLENSQTGARRKGWVEVGK